MAFHIRNRETEHLARDLAQRANIGLTEAVHRALANEIARMDAQVSLWERLAPLRTDVAKRVVNHEPADKAFLDSLYD